MLVWKAYEIDNKENMSIFVLNIFDLNFTMKCKYIFVKQNWLTNVISNNNFYPSLEVQQLPK
jgi:hypothetical protein